MALNAVATLQPWEEQQLPSPEDEKKQLFDSPLDLSRTRSTSISAHSTDNGLQLQRHLSGDPDQPPPAWKRRPSQRASSNPPPAGLPARSQSLSSNHPQRRLPNGLRMTHTNGLSPSSSRAGYPRQGPPPASFRGRAARMGTGSNRSSLASYDGMNSEELWTLEDDPSPDMSNPTRMSAERPLDTVRRMSYTINDQSLYMGLPTEIIWPTAPSDEEYLYEPPKKTKSVTSMASIRRRTTLRKSKSKGSDLDMPPPIAGGGYASKRAASKDALSSAHSSTTDLSIPHNKSHSSLSSRPGSMMGGNGYHYDLLGALAPRDGGYAIAAQIGNSFSPVSSVNSMEDRRSTHTSPPGSFRGARGTASARSSGMRWSVDGEDPILPPAPVRGSGASTMTMSSTQSDDFESPQSAQLAVAQATRPCEPSPLSMQTTTAADMDGVPSPVTVDAPQLPAPVMPPTPPPHVMRDVSDEVIATGAATNLKKSKTKKEIKAEKKEAEKQAKLAAKAEAQRAAQAKADAARKAAEDKRRAQEEAVQAKAQAKADAARKQEEAKQQKKAAEQQRIEQAKRAEQEKRDAKLAAEQQKREQKLAAEQKKQKKLAKPAEAKPAEQKKQKKLAKPAEAKPAEAAPTPQRRASLKRSAPGSVASSSATPVARSSPLPSSQSSQTKLAAPAAAAAAVVAGGAAVAAAPANKRTPSNNSDLPTGPRQPPPPAGSRPEKRGGFMTSLKKRFSMANMEPAPTLQRPRPNSIAISQGSSPAPSTAASRSQVAVAQASAPPVPAAPAPTPAAAPAAMPAPAVVQPPPQGASSMAPPVPQPPVQQQQQQQRPAMPPPVIIPPRASSANVTNPVAIPMRGSSLVVGPNPGFESSDDALESGNSNPSSVIVTPTISMDRNSTSSLLEHPRSTGVFRERSDSGISAGGSHTTEGGLHTPPSEASFPPPLQHRKDSDAMHAPPALTVA